MFRILVAASIRLYREGLAQILERREGIAIIGTASDRNEALAKVRELAPQIVLLDMATPDSHTTALEIRKLAPETCVIAIGVAEVEGDVLACAEAGVAGYLPREGSLEDLITAVESAARGEVRCSAQLVGSVWRRLAALSAHQPQVSHKADLTIREREIVQLIDQAFSNKEIARALGIEVATVKNHVHNILEKLHVSSRAQAAHSYVDPRHGHRGRILTGRA